MAPEQVAYLLVVGIAWAWSLSQVALAVRELNHWPPTWRVNAAQWITVKAFFFSMIGVLTWDDIPDYPWLVYLVAVSHLVAFVHWLRLPSPEKVDSIYLKEIVK